MLANQESNFLESVDLMFNRAVRLMNLSAGIEEKIRVCNSTYTVHFGVRPRGKIETFTDVAHSGPTGGLEGKRLVVQGLGNVEYHAAKFLSQEDGAEIVGIIDA